MRFAVVAVGRMRGDPAAVLFERYRKRLRAPLSITEIEVPAGPARARREGERLLAAVPAGAALAVLDEGGEMLSSEGLARRLASWRDGGRRDCAFLIGGADGHGADVLEKADFRLSLGRMTWPHLLVRAMLAEQLPGGDDPRRPSLPPKQAEAGLSRRRQLNKLCGYRPRASGPPEAPSGGPGKDR